VTVHGPGGDHGNQYTGGKVGNSNSATKAVKNDRSYARRRLRKSRPDLHKPVIAGKKSAPAAMEGSRVCADAQQNVRQHH
jgi:hypothetical protein